MRRRSARERSWSAQPPGEDSDVELDVDETAIKSSIISKLYAAMLIIAGIILYVYILYVMLVYLLYPCSLAPFLRRNVSTNTTTDTLHTDIGNIYTIMNMCQGGKKGGGGVYLTLF